jgi:hypothetical protein
LPFILQIKVQRLSKKEIVDKILHLDNFFYQNQNKRKNVFFEAYWFNGGSKYQWPILGQCIVTQVCESSYLSNLYLNQVI